GQFDWAPAASATLAPGESHTFTITPRDDAFELVIADPDHGDEGNWALALDRGPVKQSMDFGMNTAPTHVTQDAHGDMWVTLAGGSAIARVDPSQVRDGSESGIHVYPLNRCLSDAQCPPPFPPEPGAAPPPTRLPVQMDVEQDGAGNTVIFFAEQNASAI